uniref:Uncharacterized protein LOC104233394 n=1 Tax=Nicotiana sylvestris TaxID=4096 RepID=A0A1U7X5X3_NICSY|nr:PREDICTED: uncharacterized protein LOC104233394 [Nicotiana sylvestris]
MDNDLQWNSECAQALKELKAYLSSPLLLSKLELGECLLVYFVVSEVAVEARDSPKYTNKKCSPSYGKTSYVVSVSPRRLVATTDPNLQEKKVAKFFEKWHFKRIFSTPYYPAGNGLAESSNKSILNIMMKKLEDAKGLWPELLQEALWAYRTMPKTSIGETPYSLVYGTDAVIPTKNGEPNLRYSHKSRPRNDESRRQELDEVEEQRDMAYIRMIA